MNTIHNIARTPVSPLVASIGLLLCSIIWFLGFSAFCAGAGFHGDLSSITQAVMLTMTLMPAICFAWGLMVMGSRRGTGLSFFERGAVASAVLPVTFGTLLALRVITAMVS